MKAKTKWIGVALIWLATVGLMYHIGLSHGFAIWLASYIPFCAASVCGVYGIVHYKLAQRFASWLIRDGK